jgi:hypothetical protein
MKLNFLFLFLFIAFCLQSCDQQAITESLFKEPQPKDVKPLRCFPKRICGTYQSKDGVFQLLIYADYIIKKCSYQLKFKKDEMDSSMTLISDTLLSFSENNKIRITIINDSIVSNISFSDTIFAFTQNDILKKYKGSFFMNFNEGPDEWLVKKLSVHNGMAIISVIDSMGLASLKEITETKNDTLSQPFKPTKKQFKKLLYQDGFNNNDTFWRVRN